GENFLETLQAKDIGEGGIGIIAPNQFKGCSIDKIVSVTVSLPTPVKKSFMADARIRHISGNSFGITFMGLSLNALNLLQRYVSSKKDCRGTKF
ncbi:MAG: PilZ domain-containing protein, partial [Pseudomonadota bacterium]